MALVAEARPKSVAGPGEAAEPAPVPALALQEQQPHLAAQLPGSPDEGLHQGLDLGLPADHVVQHQKVRAPGLPAPPALGEGLDGVPLQQARLPALVLGPQGQLQAEPALALPADPGDLHPGESVVGSEEPLEVLECRFPAEKLDRAGDAATVGGRVGEFGVWFLWLGQLADQRAQQSKKKRQDACCHGDHLDYARVVFAKLLQPIDHSLHCVHPVSHPWVMCSSRGR